MKTLLYPSAGEDWKIVLKQFCNEIDQFIFVDLYYTPKNIRDFKKHILKVGSIESENIIGSFDSEITLACEGKNRYKKVEPSYCILNVLINNLAKRVIFRKGFGQYALNELEDSSLYCFYHRGDSAGEGGSNTFYLANRDANHKPLAKLFDILISKLKSKSLIISDGSNVGFRKLRLIYNNISKLGKEACKKDLLGESIALHNVTLKCIDVLDYRYNHTLVWEVSKI